MGDNLNTFLTRLPNLPRPEPGWKPKPIVKIGTETEFGTVEGMRTQDGERFYFIKDAQGTVSLMPASVIEP